MWEGAVDRFRLVCVPWMCLQGSRTREFISSIYYNPPGYIFFIFEKEKEKEKLFNYKSIYQFCQPLFTTATRLHFFHFRKGEGGGEVVHL